MQTSKVSQAGKECKSAPNKEKANSGKNANNANFSMKSGKSKIA